jgi:hypothetical protein
MNAPRIAAATAAIAMCAALGSALGCARQQQQQAAPAPTPRPSVEHVRLIRSPLNGEIVPAASTKHRPIAVMVDNYPYQARPQSGLRQADVIYEVEAEGGITRYMALFLENAPPKIGPVRSARLYFVNLAQPYAPLFAHAGENDDVWEPLAELRADGFADMEEIVGVPEAFWRDDTREMPHNLYTSVARLRSAAPNHGWPDAPFGQSIFAFAKPWAPLADPVNAPGVTFHFWLNYTVHYLYDDGLYLRSIRGVIQHDLGDATPYRVADIVAVWIPARVMDSLGDLHMDVFGDFPAVAIRDGQAISCRWVQTDAASLPRVLTSDGQPVTMQPGQIYIEVLPQGGSVTVGKQTWTY